MDTTPPTKQDVMWVSGTVVLWQQEGHEHVCFWLFEGTEILQGVWYVVGQIVFTTFEDASITWK